LVIYGLVFEEGSAKEWEKKKNREALQVVREVKSDCQRKSK